MRIFILLLAFVSIISCKKTKPVVYQSRKFTTYENSSLTKLTSPRLFTKNGEITTSHLVNKFTQDFDQYLYTASSSFNDSEFQSFLMYSDDSLVNSSIPPLYDLVRSNTDTYDFYKSGRLAPVNDTNALFLHIGQYKRHFLATTPLGYTYAEYESPACILKKVNDTLFVPFIRYIVVSRQPGMISFSAEKMNNVFASSGAQKLGNKDTMLIQTFDVAFIKK